MEVPPPYIPAQPKKNRTLIIFLVVFGLLVCCGLPIALLGGGWFLFNKGKPLVPCVMGLSQASRAVVAYVDKNGKYPEAAKWQEQVKPFFTVDKEVSSQLDRLGIKTPNIDEPLVCWNEEPKTGIAYNADLSGKLKKDLADKLSTIVLFETPTVKYNNAEKYVKRPKADAPKIFGGERDWMEFSLDDAMNPDKDFDVKIKTRIDKGVEAAKEESAETPTNSGN